MRSVSAKFPAALLTAWCACLLTGCALSRHELARQYIDERTGVTVTAANETLVFAREAPTLAANARDYLSFEVIDVNRSGEHRLYFFGYLWSTVDRSLLPGRVLRPTSLTLLADDRPISLRLASDPLAQAFLSAAPWKKPTKSAVMVLYAIDRTALSYVASAHRWTLRPEDAAEAALGTYTLWRDGMQGARAVLGKTTFPTE